MEAAQANFEALLAREPGSGPVRFRLSIVHARRGRLLTAIALAEQALSDEPDRIEVLTHLARCHLLCGHPEAARRLATQALSLPRKQPAALDSLGVVLTRLDEPVLAMELFDQAIALDPDQASRYFNRALAHKQFGQSDAAERDLESCIALKPGHAKAHWMLSTLRTQDLGCNHLQRLRAQLDRTDRSPGEQELLALALFKELDDLADVSAAALALQRGIASRGAASTRDAPGATDALIAVCDEGFSRPRPLAKGGAAPVFILGMPRSGVALLGKLLSRHSKLQHLGFQPVFSRLLSQELGRDPTRRFDAEMFEQCRAIDFESLGRRYLAEVSPAAGKQLVICESHPMNFQLAGFIARALPGARMLHLMRDPIDNCVSILGHAGAETRLPDHDPAQLAACYREYQRLMQHWHQVLPDRIFDVSYESLVEKPEMVLRVVCSFLGIRYGSALRMGLQLHRRSIGRGARYAPYLPGLAAGLDPLSPAPAAPSRDHAAPVTLA